MVGYEFVWDCATPTPRVLALNIHDSRAPDLIPHHLRTRALVEVHGFRDSYGNWCSRLLAPRRVNFTGLSVAVWRDCGDVAPTSGRYRAGHGGHLGYEGRRGDGRHVRRLDSVGMIGRPGLRRGNSRGRAA